MNGEHFEDKSTLRCIFDSDVHNAIFINSTQINCIAPPQATATNVVLTITGNDFNFVYRQNFTYREQPRIERIFPHAGSVFGSIILCLSHVADNLFCLFRSHSG